MLGQIVYTAEKQGKVRLNESRVLGLPVLQVPLNPDGYWAKRRLRKAGKLLRRAGIRRVLVPEEFGDWSILESCALQEIDTAPFLRAHAGQLALAALRRCGEAPQRSAVAIRGIRADRDVVNAARELCPQVRDMCISVLQGGEQLSEHLRWEYGAAVCPDHAFVDAAVRFDPRTWERGSAVLDLFAPSPGLCGGAIAIAGAERGQQQSLALLAALWEVGKVHKRDLEFT